MTRRGRGHPRTAGTFACVIGHYVREEQALPLMEALRKMTVVPARRFEGRVPGMRSKGRLREGADADVVVFAPDRIGARATFEELTPSEGMRYVLVNGVVVARDGVVQDGVLPGRPVRAPVSELPSRASTERSLPRARLLDAPGQRFLGSQVLGRDHLDDLPHAPAEPGIDGEEGFA